MSNNAILGKNVLRIWQEREERRSSERSGYKGRWSYTSTGRETRWTSTTRLARGRRCATRKHGLDLDARLAWAAVSFPDVQGYVILTCQNWTTSNTDEKKEKPGQGALRLHNAKVPTDRLAWCGKTDKYMLTIDQEASARKGQYTREASRPCHGLC